MHVRRVAILGISVALAASLAACSSSSGSSKGTNGGDSGAPTGGNASTPSGGSANNQTLRVAVDALPAGKGNPFNSVGTPGIYTFAAIYDTMTFVDKDGTVKPWLATSWKNVSPTSWDFTLRPNVKFSDGEALDAQGVAKVITFMKSSADLSKSAVAGDLSNIAAAKAVDGATLEITTSTPDPLLPNKLSELFVPAPDVLTQKGVQALTQNPVGTGPFKVKNWGANKITLTAFTGSWHAPKVGALEIQALPDPASRVQALQSGQVDLVTAISPDQAKQLTGAVKADLTKAAQVMSLAFINSKGNSPLAKKEVRQALNYAVNKDVMAKSLLLGEGEATGQGASPGAVGYNPDIKPYQYDVSKAKQLLAAAGYPNGFKFTADVVVGSFPADAQIYELMKQDLAKVGVDVKLQQVTFASWLKFYLSNSWDAQAFGLSWNSLPTMDGARAMGLFSCLKKPAFFCDQPTAQLLEKAMSNMDLTERSQQLNQVAQAMYDNPPALYLVRQIDINGVSTKLQGFDDNNRYFPYSEMFKN